MTKTAVVLAAGKGQRLQPLSARRPKGMFLLAGKPIIQHVLDAAKSLGVSKAVIVVDGEDAVIRSFIGDGAWLDLEVEFVLQKEPGGSATALRLAGLQDAGEDVYVFPANVFIDADTVASLKDCTQTTMLVALATGDHEQGIPTVRKDRLVAMSSEHPDIGSTRVSTGIHHVTAEFLSYLSESGSDEKYLDAALGHFAEDHDVQVREAGGVWEPLIDPWDIIRINERAMKGIDVRIGDNVDIDDTAVLVPPVWIGDGTHIGERAVIGPYVAIRSNARVGALCEIRDSVINNNVRIDTRCVIRGSILDDGVGAGAGLLAPNGVIVPADVSLGTGVIFEVRTIVEPGADVESGTIVKGE